MNGGYIPICPQMYKGDESSMGVRPLPCVRDENGAIREQTVKQHFAKINEELDELKEAVTILITFRDLYGDHQKLKKDDMCWIAEEAADVKTAITTLEEALGIDAAMRDEAQRRVNHKNFSRGRL